MDSNTNGISATTTTSVSTSLPAPDAASAKVDTSKPTTTATAAPKPDPALQRDPRSLQFQVDGNRVITTIIDKNDKTIVVQIPDADMIRIAKQIDRMQGFLIKAKA